MITMAFETGRSPVESVGWFTMPIPLIHMVDDPPPSRFMALTAPSACICWPS